MRRHLHLALASVLLPLLATAAGAARGPATPEEREKLVSVVAQLEREPLAASAAESRQWVLSFLQEVPDITAKQCLGLFGPPQERQGIAQELALQQLFSNAAYVVANGAPAGSTEALTAGLEGALRVYEAMKAADAKATHPRLEQLLQLQRDGQLVPYVRAVGRGCR